jgi:phosphate acetyltransferase
MPAERVSDAGLLRTSSPAAHRAGAKYDGLIAKAKNVSATKTIVLHPCDEASLRGPIEAAEAGIIVPILVGPATKITAVAREHKLDISP